MKRKWEAVRYEMDHFNGDRVTKIKIPEALVVGMSDSSGTKKYDLKV